MAGAPRKGNRPDEVEGGGTGQICFAGAALLCRAANPFREGLKVAAPVSSGRVAFPANERARPPLPPPQPPTSGATGAAPPTLYPHPLGEPSRGVLSPGGRADPTFAEVQLEQQQLQQQQPGERRPAHAARSLGGSAPCAGCAQPARRSAPRPAPPPTRPRPWPRPLRARCRAGAPWFARHRPQGARGSELPPRGNRGPKGTGGAGTGRLRGAERSGQAAAGSRRGVCGRLLERLWGGRKEAGVAGLVGWVTVSAQSKWIVCNVLGEFALL